MVSFLEWTCIAGQIKPEESLFVYNPGLGPNNYSHPEHIPVFTDELVISDEVRQACQGNTACMFDAASTNSTMVGLSTMKTGEMLATERVSLGEHSALKYIKYLLPRNKISESVFLKIFSPFVMQM